MSAYMNPQRDYSHDDLPSQLGSLPDNAAATRECAFGDFKGIHAEFVDDHFWLRWALFHRNVLLLATYNCQPANVTDEPGEVTRMLKTLKPRSTAKRG
jgi:hypothetical protein